jgi:hypothetical protein
MASLSNNKIKQSYQGLLKTNDNAAIDGSPKIVTDGLGNALPMAVSTTDINFSGNIDFSSAIVTGVQGVGTQGPQGATGDQGFQGSQGDTGLTGAQGPQGIDGLDGDQGPTGPQGDIGAQGDLGPTGPQGNAGDQGPIGPQGDTGAQGDLGPTGPQGDAGVQGPIGPQGDTGAQGDLGPTGPQGDLGPAGPQGDTGAQGDLGPAGAQGDLGPAGPQGDPGIQGFQGFQGDQGPAGGGGGGGATVFNTAQGFQFGIYKHARVNVTSTSFSTDQYSMSSVNNSIYLVPFQFQPGEVINEIYFGVGTASTAGSVRVGLYSLATDATGNGTPVAGSLISDFGTVSTASAGLVSITGLNVTIPDTTEYGMYLFAFAQDEAWSIRAVSNSALGFTSIPLVDTNQMGGSITYRLGVFNGSSPGAFTALPSQLPDAIYSSANRFPQVGIAK